MKTIEDLTRAQMRATAAETERRLLRGCAGCGAPVVGRDGKPVPGSTIVYLPWAEVPSGCSDPGTPMCGECLHRLGVLCAPGDDYCI